MKKLLSILLLAVVLLSEAYAQPKVNFTLSNPRFSGGFFLYDLNAVVPTGKFWRPGACNIRINFSTVGTGNLVIKADNPMVNANPNISNANGYQAMTTTSYLSGTVLSANILTFNTSGFYRFNPGTHLLGTVRWTATPLINNVNVSFRMPPSANPTLITDSTIFLDTTEFTITNPIITGNYIVSSEIPTEFKLYENYPNPFNPSTSIKYDIAKNSFVRLTVYDITGKEIETLVSDNLEAGRYEATWSGSNFASGVYFAKIESGDYKHVIRMLMVK